MSYFLKLIAVSMLYALIVFIPFELMLNVYRISRLGKWGVHAVNVWTNAALIAVFIGGTIVVYSLTKKWFDERKVNGVTSILWLPYFVLFVLAFALLFPLTNGGDAPNPVAGLFAIGGLLGYPFYILFLNSIAMERNAKAADL